MLCPAVSRYANEPVGSRLFLHPARCKLGSLKVKLSAAGPPTKYRVGLAVLSPLSYSSVVRLLDLLGLSSCRRKCERFRRVCCTPQWHHLGSRSPSSGHFPWKTTFEFHLSPLCSHSRLSQSSMKYRRRREMKPGHYGSYDCGLKRLDSWRQWVAKGCEGRFRAWLGAGVGAAGSKRKMSSEQNLFRNKWNEMPKNNHLLDQACFQKAWSRSSGGPAGLQEESSARFLVKEGCR